MDNIILTEKGLALRDKLNAGQTTATFIRFCTSSAEYDQSELGALTELKDSKLESAVTNLEILEDHTMVISGAVDNKSLQEGYYITLIGLYAKETDGEEILFAVSKVSSPMYMPEKSGALSGMSIRFSIKIENADSVNVTVDPTTAATLGDLIALKKEVLTPTFEDYESKEAPEIPDLDSSLKQIKSGNTLEIILQNVKSGFKGVVALLNKKVNQTDYDETVRKLNGDITVLNNNRSHIGMIVMSTKLDTQAKVIALYGGTTWTQIGGRFLIGANSTYKVGTTGGSSTHKITEGELPSHTHSIPELSGKTDSAGAHSHALSGADWPFKWVSTQVSNGPWATPWNQKSNVSNGSGQAATNSTGAHTHSVTTKADTTGSKGSGTTMAILNPYKAVYIWERTA